MIKIFLTSLSALLCCILFMGAVGFNAPVMPSKDFYVNDHAGVLEKQERGEILKTAREIYENTGVRAVVLTVESFDGFEPAEYADIIFNSWQLGEAQGAIGSKGILILLCTEERHIVWATNTDVPAGALDTAEFLAAEGKFSEAVSTCFFSVADNIYGKERINGGGSAVFIEPQIVPYGALPESSKKWQTAQKAADKQERSDTARGVISAGIIGIIILYAGVTQRKIIKFNRNNRVNRGAYQRTEYISLVERHDDDDYPTGFGGLGNRKAIYGEDVNEADDIGIIKREKYNRQSPDN